MRFWSRIADIIDTNGQAALVSISAVEGSAPRGVGARMVVRPDGAFHGTIGGGALEFAMLTEARSVLAEAGGKPAARLIRQSLGPDLGQCCGGRVDVSIEVFARVDRPWIRPLVLAEQTRGAIETLGHADAHGRLIRRLNGRSEPGARAGEKLERFGELPTRVLLFGAGHIGRALVLALAPLPFNVDWIDSRAEAFPAATPDNVEMWQLADPTTALQSAPEGALVVAVTHSHPLDLAIVARALGDARFGYVGMIGSDTKRQRFLGMLERLGLGSAARARLVCPIGGRRLADKSPSVIAAAVAVELLTAREAAGLSQPL